MLKRIARAGGVLSAPWIYGIGRLLKSPALFSATLRVDPLYIRADQDRLRMAGHSMLSHGQLVTALGMIAATSSDADLSIKGMISKSQSQLLQDIACMLAHGNKRDGYFVEVGVGNGKDISNTYMLEKQFGWTGLLIEPNLGFHDQIRNCRKARRDIRAAASKGGEQVEFEEYLNAGEFSKLASVKGHSPDTEKIRKYMVETVTLDKVLAENDAPSQIDYMSIDTEGSELDILKGLDLNKHTVGFFTIEHNFRPGNLQAIHAVLAPYGYRQILPEVSSFDAWFMHSSLQSRYVG